MLGDFLRHNKQIHCNPYLIAKGTPLVAIGYNYYQFGIHAGNSIICQCCKKRSYGFSYEIKQVAYNDFFTNHYIFEYVPEYPYDKYYTYAYAYEKIGQEYFDIRSAFGDDFVFLCMVGAERFSMAFNSSSMGFHYKMPFRINLITKAEHHAIAIEQGFVIHFSRGYDDKKTQVPMIRIDDYSNLQKAFPNNIKKVQYKNENINNRFIARNRATLVLSGLLETDTYKLFTNNCEHFANWCKTGKASSTQVRQGLIDTAVIAGSILAKRPNSYVIKALKRHFF